MGVQGDALSPNLQDCGVLGIISDCEEFSKTHPHFNWSFACKPVLWVLSQVRKTSLVLKETSAHVWKETRREPAEVSLPPLIFAVPRETSASREQDYPQWHANVHTINYAYLKFLPKSTNATLSHAERPIKHKSHCHLEVDTTFTNANFS